MGAVREVTMLVGPVRRRRMAGATGGGTRMRVDGGGVSVTDSTRGSLSVMVEMVL